MRLSWFSDNIKLTINFPRAGLRTHDKKPKIERRRIEVQSLIGPDPRLNTVSVPNFFQSYLAAILFFFYDKVIAVRLIALFYSKSLI